MRIIVPLSAFLVSTAVAGMALAEEATFDINRISESGVGDKIGTASVSESSEGLVFKINVKGLPAGQRGLHVHEKGNCGPAMKDGKMTAGAAAGPHYDPDGHKSHQGPEGDGHKGDLPALNVSADLHEQSVTAPRLKMADVAGRSLMIHAGGDNYTDQPENGGGKGRIACGVIPK